MQGDGHSLFNAKTLQRYASSVSISSEQKNAAKEWLELLHSGKLADEKSNYLRFASIVLEKILGYPILQTQYETGNVEFLFSDSTGKMIACFEAKGTSTKDLFAIQYRDKKEHETPIKQTWDYMGKNALKYGICTNYKDFVLIDRNKGYSKYHIFDFESISDNYDRLREFILVFSKKSVIDESTLDRLYNDSVEEEREFTEEFYKLYHETRLMLIKEFQENGQIEKVSAVKYAQLFLNRLIFMFFAEDTEKLPNKLFENSVASILNHFIISDNTKTASTVVSSLFERLDKGAQSPIEIFGFNGGLFKEKIPDNVFFKDFRPESFFKDLFLGSKLKRQVRLNEKLQALIAQFQHLNPIIRNLLLMASFDFKTELRVDILGHIFEHSLVDLEELKSGEVSRRRKEGIFYTPEFVTDYVCRNAILGYLSNDNATNVTELLAEYVDDLESLEEQFKSIKILDPACGSGAFLLKAVDVLLEIHKGILSIKESRGAFAAKARKKKGNSTQLMLDKWQEEAVAAEIIENNIYGVDVNEESVEITRLSLFLRISSKNRKLIDLSKNIRQGNSLIEDESFAGSLAFNWNTKFKEIMNQGGFDVVIGNPPYVRSMQTVAIKPYLQKNYTTYAGDADLYVYFFEKGISLLKDGGIFSIIVSSKFTKARYALNLRNYLLSFDIRSFIDFGDLPVFEDASTYPCIITIHKSKPSGKIKSYKVDSLSFASLDDYLNNKERMVEYFPHNADGWYFEDDNVKDLLSKIQDKGQPLDTIVKSDQFFRGITTGFNQAFVITENQRKVLIEKDRKSAEIIFPYLSGREIKRYRLEWEGNYIIFARRGLDISQYPAILHHLENFKKQLTPRDEHKSGEQVGRKPGNYKWYEIQDSTEYWEIFLQEGIIFPHFNKYSNFTFTAGGFFPNNKAYVIANSDRFLLAILNSKLMNFYLKSVCPFVRGEYYEYMPQYVEKFPIAKNRQYAKEISNGVEKITKASKQIFEIRRKVHARIMDNLHVKITTRLYDFHKISFGEFLKEINKQKKHLSLEEQDDWEAYLKLHSETINKLSEEAQKTDAIVDRLVFESYDLTDEEKQIIENDLKETKEG